LYFVTEARKLYAFQAHLEHADLMLTVSTADQKYLQEEFPDKRIEYLPSFHPYNEVTARPGRGEYVLYHGNLSVGENIKAAEYLVKNVFSKLTCPIIIAGLNPSARIYEWIKEYTHIRIIENPKEPQMQELLENAHVHCLYTHQATGLKLKLVNVLYAGRFCVCNSNMLEGTALTRDCIVKDDAQGMIDAISNCFKKEFSAEMITQRRETLQLHDNGHSTRQLIRLVFADKKK